MRAFPVTTKVFVGENATTSVDGWDDWQKRRKGKKLRHTKRKRKKKRKSTSDDAKNKRRWQVKHHHRWTLSGRRFNI